MKPSAGPIVIRILLAYVWICLTTFEIYSFIIIIIIKNKKKKMWKKIPKIVAYREAMLGVLQC